MTDRKPFTLIAATIFLLIALVHLYRLISGFEVIIAGRTLGPGFSLAGLIIGGIMSLMLFREAKR